MLKGTAALGILVSATMSGCPPIITLGILLNFLMSVNTMGTWKEGEE